MLLVCPSCRTRYVVPDTAIGMDGRQVRCANCKHSWFQDGVIPPIPPAPQAIAPNPPPEQYGSVAVPPVQPAAPDYTRSDETAESQAEPAKDISETFTSPDSVNIESPPQQSHFAHEPPFRPRRNPAKLWTMAAFAFALMIAAGGGAIWYYGVPNIGMDLGMAGAEPDLKIILNENLELNEREDGTPFFIASGSIVNPTGRAQRVPEMLVTLKDSGGRPVYSWKMKAKVRSLAPGAKVDFSEARLDVPQAAAQITVGWVL
ncbi:thioredoxin [Sphingorhabdus sp. IMCC26285]|uniref:Thioredoxin n=1 Tax=Sphingorhabdus profundilacus TaxID=2509718 RepID=A0A6I4M439_9SPHN|nr:MJ0042-type zinc finger domain-containing protein [Sphingorhabdus profundilacus]MVZ98660.1 thioredoxin [Sphingorhabdus profundilacus]